MDSNRNFYPNMNNSMDINAFNLQNLQNLTPEQILHLQQLNAQKIQALEAQLAQTSMTSGNPFPAVSPVGPPPVHVHMGHAYGAPLPPMTSIMQPPPSSGVPGFHGTQAPMISTPMNVLTVNGLNGPVPNSRPSNNSDYPLTYPNSTATIAPNIANPIKVQVPNQNTRYTEVPNSLPLQNTNAPGHNVSYSSSNYSSSVPSTPQDSPASTKKQNPQYDIPDGSKFAGDRPRQRVSSPPPAKPPSSSRSSTSSASIPGSPGSSGPLSPDSTWSDGQFSPDGTPRKTNGESRPGAQIKNKPLQMETRYPQDKCYTCMKKVYPMEKLGPVKGVVYHKTCFKCKTCNTTLNLQNFTHSQTDQFDLSAYCKSHQPLSSGKGPKLDAQSIEIKSALQAPKKGGMVGETERVPVHKYSYDVTCREIEHARKAPVAQLQSGVKQSKNAWSKSKRETFPDSPRDVVRHDDVAPEYHQDEYNRYKIESEPDYT